MIPDVTRMQGAPARNRQLLVEMVAVITVTLLGLWFLPSARTLFALLPVVYLLIERHLRRRSWAALGFKARSFWADLRANWLLFGLLAFAIQPVIILWAKLYFPDYLLHIQARLPFDAGISWGVLLPLLAFSLIGEEMTYRTLLQGRLTPFVGIPGAIGVASLLFGLAHFSPGPGLVVFTDVGLIVVAFLLDDCAADLGDRLARLVLPLRPALRPSQQPVGRLACAPARRYFRPSGAGICLAEKVDTHNGSHNHTL